MTNDIRRKAFIISASIALGVPLGAAGAIVINHFEEQSYTVPTTVHTTPIQLDSFTASEGARSGYLPPCEQEDSRDCFWDAGTSGNGEGTSFVDWHGVAYYPEAP